MEDVYKNCPRFENEKYILRFVSEDDCLDLLKVYSDKNAVSLFNSDNCHGDDFYYTTEQRMKQAIDFWLLSYEESCFVRWTIIDKSINTAIGTIELFHRDADDYFTNCGLLRLDLRSDYENEKDMDGILSLIVPLTFELFDCDKIATKVIPAANERRKALLKLNFTESDEMLVGHDGTKYKYYMILYR